MRRRDRTGRKLQLESLESRRYLDTVGWDSLGDTDASDILASYASSTSIESTVVTIDKTVVADGDLITLTGRVGTSDYTETLNVLVYWGDGSAVETLTYLPGTSSFEITHTYATDSVSGTDSDYQVYYQTMEDDSSDLSYLVLSVIRYDIGLTDLGTVDYLTMETMSLDDEASYYQFDAAHSGIATLESLVASAGDDVSIELYTYSPVAITNLVPAAVSTESDDDGERLDYEVTAGQTYYVKVEGTSADFDLRITNLVSQDDTAVTVYGTDGDDEFEFSAGEDRQFTINGTLYEFGDAEISTIEFDGGEGDDLVILHDSAGDDTLEAWATEAVLSNEAGDGVTNFTVNVSGFEELHAYARYGGNDKATLYDSEGDDKFKAEPEESYAKMYGGAMYNRVKFFDVVEVYSTGGDDLARVFDTMGDDTFEGQKDASSLSGEGYEINMFGFAQVLAYASEGTDSVTFVDSEMKDELHAKPAKAELFDAATNGDVYRVTARWFDSLYAVAANTEGSSGDGGADIAKIWPTASDDFFEATEDWFEFYRDDELLYEIVAFETVKVRETTDEGDSATVTDPDYTLLLADGWE